MKFLDFLLKILTLFSEITSKSCFWSIVSLGWKSVNSPKSVLNTLGVVLLGNIGPEPQHLFSLLIRILTTVSSAIAASVAASTRLFWPPTATLINSTVAPNHSAATAASFLPWIPSLPSVLDYMNNQVSSNNGKYPLKL